MYVLQNKKQKKNPKKQTNSNKWKVYLIKYVSLNLQKQFSNYIFFYNVLFSSSVNLDHFLIITIDKLFNNMSIHHDILPYTKCPFYSYIPKKMGIFSYDWAGRGGGIVSEWGLYWLHADRFPHITTSQPKIIADHPNASLKPLFQRWQSYLYRGYIFPNLADPLLN